MEKVSLPASAGLRGKRGSLKTGWHRKDRRSFRSRKDITGGRPKGRPTGLKVLERSNERGRGADVKACGEEEGRGGRRNAPGRSRASNDPGVSEWGNPPWRGAMASRQWSGTRGIETSQYPEEKKERSIPRVAASESGGAQTAPRGGVAGRGGRRERRVPNGIERPAGGGASPVGTGRERGRGPEYGGARETLPETAGTIRQG